MSSDGLKNGSRIKLSVWSILWVRMSRGFKITFRSLIIHLFWPFYPLSQRFSFFIKSFIHSICYLISSLSSCLHCYPDTTFNAGLLYKYFNISVVFLIGQGLWMILVCSKGATQRKLDFVLEFLGCESSSNCLKELCTWSQSLQHFPWWSQPGGLFFS